MPITDSIAEARKRGVADDAILSEIERQNPAKAPIIAEARQRGADPTRIVDEIVRQKAAAPAAPMAAPAAPRPTLKVTPAGIVPTAAEELPPAAPAPRGAPVVPAATPVRTEPHEPLFGEKPTGFVERARLGFGSPTEQATRVEPRGFLAGGLAEIPRDIADVMGPAVRETGFLGGIMAGAAGGAALGSVVPGIGTAVGGVVGGILGAIGGTAIGELFRQKIGETLGLQKDITPEERRRQVGTEAILGGVAQAVAPIAGAALKPVLRIGGKAIVGAAAKTQPARRFFGEVTKDVLSKMTSVEKGAIEEVIGAKTKAARAAVRGAAAEEISRVEIAQKIANVARQVRAAAGKAFEATVATIEKKYPRGAANAARSFRSEIVDSFRAAAEARGVVFKGNKIAEIPARVGEKAAGAESNIRTAWDRVLQHKDFSVRGVNALKQDLNALGKFGDLRRAIPLVNELTGKVGRWIGAKAPNGRWTGVYPELAQLRATQAYYEEMLSSVDTLFMTGKTGVKSVREAARRLASLFKVDNELYIEALRDLEDTALKQGILSTRTMVPEVAGTLFSRESPGLLRTSIAAGALGTSVYAGFLNPAFFLLLPFFSPRFVQGVLTRMGASREFIREFVRGIEEAAVKPAARAAAGAAGRVGILEALRAGSERAASGGEMALPEL